MVGACSERDIGSFGEKERGAEIDGGNVSTVILLCVSFRLRAKDDAPWTKWRGWNMNQTMEYYQDLEEGLDSGNDDEPVEQKKSVWRESAKLRLTHEEWLDDETSLRKVNDGKGNIDFEGVDDIPKNITDINEKCRCVFWCARC